MLALSDKIQVNIRDYTYITELKKYGPLNNQLVQISTLINLLNKGIFIEIPEQFINDIYALVKQYNTVAEQSKGQYKVATTAEVELATIITGKIASHEKEEINKPNPFITPELAANIGKPQDTTFTPPVRKTKKDPLKRKRLFEVIPTEQEFANTDTAKYDDIDFSSGMVYSNEDDN